MALTAAERRIADDLLAHNLDLLRLDGALRNDALKLLLSLEKELLARIQTGTLTEFSKASVDYLLASIQGVVQDFYRRIRAQSEAALLELPLLQQAAVRAALVGVGYGASLSPLTHFAVAMTEALIMGAPQAEWWSRQATDTTFKFSNVVRRGIVQGDTNQTIIRGVREVMTVSRANAATLVQTSVQTVANVSLMDTFRQNADVINGVKQLSTLDSHTTDICIAYSGAEWNLEEKPINGNKLPFNSGPPRHWNCRSMLIPLTKSFEELGLTDQVEMLPTQRASMDGPISADTTFASFLDRKGVAFQDEALGPGRAQLWRDGKITLPQLLDLRGNPLTLEQLKKKYAK